MAAFAAVHKLPVRPHAGSGGPAITLAVLPLRDLGTAPSHNLVAEGMTQELITHLGKLDAARFVLCARTGKAGQESGANGGGAPRVEYVLEGSTQWHGSRLRLTVQLIKTSDQSYVWVESYDQTTDDVLHTQADLAAQIAAAVREKLTR
jgi:TolB-like protein